MNQVFNIASGDDRTKFYAIQAIKSLPTDKAMTVTIEPTKKKRSLPQNKLMWSSLLGDFSDQVVFNGKRFSPDAWNRQLKIEFLPVEFNEEECLPGYFKWEALPSGMLNLKGSTTQLTKIGFENYLHKCYAYGNELDIRFTANPRDYL